MVGLFCDLRLGACKMVETIFLETIFHGAKKKLKKRLIALFLFSSLSSWKSTLTVHHVVCQGQVRQPQMGFFFISFFHLYLPQVQPALLACLNFISVDSRKGRTVPVQERCWEKGAGWLGPCGVAVTTTPHPSCLKNSCSGYDRLPPKASKWQIHHQNW